MTNAIRAKAADVTARTNVAASDRDVAERFSAAVVEFSAGDLAKAARRTKAAAKGWKDASRCPSGASLINMAATIPAVRNWLNSEIDRGARDAQAGSADAVARALRELANVPGPEGDAIRAVMRSLATPEPRPTAELHAIPTRK